MAIFPEYDYEMDEEVTEEVTSESVTIGRTPLFDFETGQYVIRDGKVIECTQEEALAVFENLQRPSEFNVNVIGKLKR